MVLAKGGAPCGDIVFGIDQTLPQRGGILVGRAHPAQGQIHTVEANLTVDEAEALANRHLMRQT